MATGTSVEPAPADGPRGAGRLVPRGCADTAGTGCAPDLVAGIVIWSVVTPQAVAYAQIAGLPPVAGLIAAPGALIGYALIGTSRTLVVCATTATSALSASAVGPLAHGDTAHFAALSAAFALVTRGCSSLGGLLAARRRSSDLVSKPVMTGLPLRARADDRRRSAARSPRRPDGSGDFFPRVSGAARRLGAVQPATAAVGGSGASRCSSRCGASRRTCPASSSSSSSRSWSRRCSASTTTASTSWASFPRRARPRASRTCRGTSASQLIGPGARRDAPQRRRPSASPARSRRRTATRRRRAASSSRSGASNLLAGVSSGFVQSGGASQTAAAESAGGRTQLAVGRRRRCSCCSRARSSRRCSRICRRRRSGRSSSSRSPGSSTSRELRRFARLRRSAIVLALVALGGVLVLGVLPGLLVAAGSVARARSCSCSAARRWTSSRARPGDGRVGAARHPCRLGDVRPACSSSRIEGPLWYGNAVNGEGPRARRGRRRGPAAARRRARPLTSPDLDVQGLDTLAELEAALERDGVELRLAGVSGPRAQDARARRARRARPDRRAPRRRRQRGWSANTVAQSSLTLTTVQPSARAASRACSAPPV